MTKKQFLKTLTISSAILASVAFSAQALADDAVEAPATTAVDATTSTLATTATPSDAKVETKVIEKATTEYVADPSLEHGTTQVVQEAKDTTETTTTTYTSVQVPQGAITDDTYRFNEGTAYTIDNSKEIPSDRIVIDETKLYKELPADIQEFNKNESIISNSPSPRESVMTDNRAGVGLALANSEFVTVPNEYVQVNNPNIELVLAGRSISFTDKRYWLFNSISTAVYNLSSAGYLVDVIKPKDDSTDDDWSRYYASQYITDGLYADAKANMKRLENVYNELKRTADEDQARQTKELESKGSSLEALEAQEKEDNAKFNTEDAYSYRHAIVAVEKAYKDVQEAFDTITQRYNNSRGYVDLAIDYSEAPSMPEDERKEFEELIAKIPAAIRQNIIKINVIDGDIGDVSAGGIAAGLSLENRRVITLRRIYEEKENYYIDINDNDEAIKIYKKGDVTYTPKELLSNLLHELSHNIDFNSGRGGSVGLEKDYLSSSKEFVNIYKTYYQDGEKSKKNIWSYLQFSDTRSDAETYGEAFADGLGEYIANKVFEKPYKKYIYRKPAEGQGADVRGVISVSKDGEKKADKYYAEGYSAAEAAKDYFAKVYDKLMATPVVGEKLVDSAVTTTNPGQNGKVLVGTKPTVTETEMPFATKEVASADLYEGERKVVTPGQTGLKRTTVTYSLKDKSSAELVAKTSEEVVRQVIDQVVAVGTAVKPVWQVPSDYPTVELPEIPIKMEVPKDYPTVELPAITIETEVPSDYPTVELPEIPIDMQVPTDYPTVELPAITIETEVPADFPTAGLRASSDKTGFSSTVGKDRKSVV